MGFGIIWNYRRVWEIGTGSEVFYRFCLFVCVVGVVRFWGLGALMYSRLGLRLFNCGVGRGRKWLLVLYFNVFDGEIEVLERMKYVEVIEFWFFLRGSRGVLVVYIGVGIDFFFIFKYKGWF